MSTSPPSSRLPVAALAVLALLGNACAVGPSFHRPPAPPVSQYTSGGDPRESIPARGAVQRFTPGGPLAADWWKLFGSHELEAVIDEALARNPQLKAAQASLRASEYDLRAGYGVFFPQAQAQASAIRQRATPLKFGENLPASLFNLFTLSASVNYALDVFGGERRTIEALGAQRDVARASERATYLALTANVANTVIAAAAYRAEIDATHELIEMQSEQVRLAEVQARAGTLAYSGVLGLRSQLATSQAQIPQLEQKLTQSEDLLATLCGHVPAELAPLRVRLADFTLPAELPVSVPSDLVRQRPDILAAEATAHAASAEVGVATAAMLPSIELSGTYSANSLTTQHLLDPQGRAWSAGGELTAPLFQGGTLWYHRKSAASAYEQALAQYRQTVLTAFAQVADTLKALEHDAQVLAAEDDALAAAQEALHLTQANYQAGLATYLDVLTADGQFHEAQIADVQALAQRYQDTVALYVALGGGWWNARH